MSSDSRVQSDTFRLPIPTFCTPLLRVSFSRQASVNCASSWIRCLARLGEPARPQKLWPLAPLASAPLQIRGLNVDFWTRKLAVTLGLSKWMQVALSMVRKKEEADFSVDVVSYALFFVVEGMAGQDHARSLMFTDVRTTLVLLASMTQGALAGPGTSSRRCGRCS